MDYCMAVDDQNNHIPCGMLGWYKEKVNKNPALKETIEKIFSSCYKKTYTCYYG